MHKITDATDTETGKWYLVPVKVGIYEYIKPYYEAVSFLMAKSQFVIADVNYNNPITVKIIQMRITITCNCILKIHLQLLLQIVINYN